FATGGGCEPVAASRALTPARAIVRTAGAASIPATTPARSQVQKAWTTTPVTAPARPSRTPTTRATTAPGGLATRTGTRPSAIGDLPAPGWDSGTRVDTAKGPPPRRRSRPRASTGPSALLAGDPPD